MAWRNIVEILGNRDGRARLRRSTGRPRGRISATVRRCGFLALLFLPVNTLVAASLEWTTPEHAVTLPAEVSQNVMFAQLELRGSRLRFLIDSGASSSVLDSRTAARLGLATRHSESMTTSGAAVTAGRIGAVDVRAPQLIVRQVPFVTASLEQMATHFDRQIDGILGYDFLAPLVVEIDFAGRALTLAERGRPPSTGSACLPLEMRARLPYVDATIVTQGQTPIVGHFMVDTGASGTLQLEGALAANPTLRSATDEQGQVGHGVGGEFTMASLRVRRVLLGPYELHAPRISLSQGRGDRGDGLLGGAILRRFTVVVDYARKQLCLRPNRQFAEGFTSDLSGLTPVWPEPELAPLTVESVTAGSAADRAGLKPGDVIEAIGERPAREVDVDELAALLRKPGARYALKITRASMRMDVTLELPVN